MNIRKRKKPAFIIDRQKALLNLERMVKKAATSGVGLRPHVKTHYSPEIASWMKQFEVRNITVSSLDIAKHFAASGWEDILIAAPVNIHQVPTACLVDAVYNGARLTIIILNNSTTTMTAHQEHPGLAYQPEARKPKWCNSSG